jgi:hypothetical protein
MTFPVLVAKTALESPEFEQYIVSFVINTTHAVHPAENAKDLISFSSY